MNAPRWGVGADSAPHCLTRERLAVARRAKWQAKVLGKCFLAYTKVSVLLSLEASISHTCWLGVKIVDTRTIFQADSKIEPYALWHNRVFVFAQAVHEQCVPHSTILPGVVKASSRSTSVPRVMLLTV